ncbi:MAG: SdrD B-like domain-containing protein, partial [Nitriliruptorales bacterium]
MPAGRSDQRATGAFVPNAFNIDGVLYDAVAIRPDGTSLGQAEAAVRDVDDLAIDPSDGALYGVANAQGTQDRLVVIDKSTGIASAQGGWATTLGVTDIEGFGFSNVGAEFGDFYAVTGDQSATEANKDSYWEIDLGTGTVNTPQFVDFRTVTSDTNGTSLADLHDYESIDCLANIVWDRQVTGTVFVDADSDGVLDGGESGIAGVAVRLYVDENNDGQVAGGDSFVDQILTAADGTYSFTVSIAQSGNSPRNYVLELNGNSVPGGVTRTTDRFQRANFVGSPPTPDPSDTGNDFGFVPRLLLEKTVANTSAGAAAGDAAAPGDELTYTVTVTNDSGVTHNNVRIADETPAGTTETSCSYTVLDSSANSTSGPAPCGASPNRIVALDDVDLDPNDVITITLVVTVDASPGVAVIRNTACRESDETGAEICDTANRDVGRSIGDTVFRDDDRDGTQDGGEPGIDGVTVTLRDSGSNTVGTAVTSGGGQYLFVRRTPGDYTVDVDENDTDLPANHTLSTGNDPAAVTSLATADRLDVDFGFQPPAAAPPPPPPPP